MSFEIQLTADAVRDLEEIYGYIDRYDSRERAEYVLSQIERVVRSLSEHPQRGSYPLELLDIGVREYREVYFKPYRIVHRIREGDVFILLIADGRRNMYSLLLRRLLQA